MRGVEGLRIEDQGGHAVEDGVAVGFQRGGVGGAAAGERAAEDFAHRRQRVAFVQAERQQRTERRFVHHLRFGSRPPVFVDQIARHHRQPFVIGHPSLAEGDAAGGEIQQQRRAARPRENGAERVGAEAAIAAAERRHHRIAHHVDEVNRDKTGAGALLRPMADAADMVRVVQRHRRQAQLAGAFNAQRHCFAGHHLTETARTVERQHRAGVAHHFGVLIELQLPLRQRRHVAGDHADAVRVVPGQIGLHQMIGHQLGFARRTAGLAPNRLNELRQMRAGDTVFGAHHAVLMRGECASTL